MCCYKVNRESELMSMLRYPKPFEVTFRPRSKQVLDMLRD
jgi:hypothetical protein